jgi:crotonobetainyl-CoA:carnitine CoA-transferase CaiB-like acyl-CoA transferase
VADLSSGIGGGYCTKLLVDAGAEVVKLEDPAGDPLRSWSATGSRAPSEDGVLFRYLASGKQSVLVDPGSVEGLERASQVISSSDAVVWSPGSALAAHGWFSPSALVERFPAASVVAVTPFGLTGPWADRPATEFTVQAWAGAIGWRGLPGRPPLSVAGRVGEWVAGVYAANGLLASVRRGRRDGRGELVDVAILDAVTLTLTNMHPVTYLSEAGMPRDPRPMTLLPGNHACSDGWVGFMTGTGQQWQDFCVLVERFDWLEDESLIRASAREARRDEISTHIDAWARQRTTEEIVTLASALRVPVAPLGNGRSIPDVDHFVDREMFATAADGSFVQPVRPYRLGGTPTPPPGPAPLLGADTARWSGHMSSSTRAQQGTEPNVTMVERPFADLRIVELAAFWAGPSAAHLFAALGAEVIKIESPARPDGMRTVSTRALDEPDWWEYAPLYHAVNTGKLDVGLRLDRPRGREVLERLLATSDVVIENFSPRVVESWELDWDRLHQINPSLIMVRMPAFGLGGPWRDRTGFAQTMEQASGMAWLTGYPDAAPLVPSGVCDPSAGAHAAFALQVALAERERTGLGTLVEVPMVQSALNIAAEQVLEFSAYGQLLNRRGNRGWTAVPQNLYRVDGPDDGTGGPYIALAIETDEQWRRLVAALGDPAWAADSTLAAASGRRAAEDDIDRRLQECFAVQPAEEVVKHLWAAGVPVARVTMPHAPAREQLDARGFFETVEQPGVGPAEVAGLPMRFSAMPGPIHRAPAPRLGEHNQLVLTQVLGLDLDEIAALEADGTVGAGVHIDR